MHRRLITLVLGLVFVLAPASPAFAQAAPGCQYVLGFRAIHDAIPAIVGNCVDNEHPAGSGEEQHTAGGLMAWRKADNWTAFTDGYHTWVNGPNGIAERLNSQRFSWEKDPLGATGPALGCASGDPLCSLAQQVLPRPDEVPSGFTLASEWRDRAANDPTYNARLTNGTTAVTVRVEPRPSEYGDDSANSAYTSVINPGAVHDYLR